MASADVSVAYAGLALVLLQLLMQGSSAAAAWMLRFRLFVALAGGLTVNQSRSLVKSPRPV
jgi:hypothetical protein